MFDDHPILVLLLIIAGLSVLIIMPMLIRRIQHRRFIDMCRTDTRLRRGQEYVWYLRWAPRPKRLKDQRRPTPPEG